MGRSGFKETSFVCVICGTRFKALAGPTPPKITYCANCGLKYTAEQLDALRRAAEGKARR